MNINISSNSIHDVYCVVRFEFPRPSLERIWKIVESAYWAQVHHVPRQLISDHAFNVGADLISFTSTDLPQTELSSYHLGEPHTPSAVNASSHAGLNKRT